MKKLLSISALSAALLSNSVISATSIGGYPLSTVELNTEVAYFHGDNNPFHITEFIKSTNGQLFGLEDIYNFEFTYGNFSYCDFYGPFQCPQSLNVKSSIIKSRDGVFDKPVYFIKGLSISENGFVSEQDELASYWASPSFNDIFTTLLNGGRDIVFIDFIRIPNEDRFQDESYLVGQIAQLVHFIETKEKVGHHQSTMVGYSYGGLLAKQVLNKLESERYQHEIYNYISLDAPHRGASLPYSLINTVKRIRGRLEDARGCSRVSSCDRNRKKMRELERNLTEGIAAKLLITGSKSNSYFRSRLNEGYPSTYNVAFSNGSYTGRTAGLPENYVMARFEVNYSLYGDTYYTIDSENIRSNYKAPFYYTSHVFDNAPGSYALVGDFLNGFLASNSRVRNVTNNLYARNINPTFITTASALDLKVSNLNGPFSLSGSTTPFDKVYAVSGSNLSHTDFSYHKNSIVNEINRAQ